MERKYMTFATAMILVVTIGVTFLLMHVPNIHGAAIALHEQREDHDIYSYVGRQSVFDALKESEEQIKEQAPQEVEDILKGHQIRLELPKNVTSASVAINNIYVNKIISISINGIGRDYFSNNPMRGNCDNIVDVTYDSDDSMGVIELMLDDVKEVKMTSEDEFIYLDLVDPHDIYDYVVVIDAGHGGKVPGAYKMGVSEKDIDLAIVLELKKIFDVTDKKIGVYYTRTEDRNPSFAARVDLPNDSEADLYLSVHNNSTASGRMSNISGTEVMYRGADSTGESKRFASICLDKLTTSLGSKNKGTVVGDEIFIIRESKAPVALVEVGFMTNQNELEKLQNADYQRQAAKALYDAIIEYLYQ